MSHTPGPWEWRHNQLWSPAAQQTLLRDVTFWNVQGNDKLLIAAAPDMLAALRIALADLTLNDSAARVVEEAIAKAIGNEKSTP